MKDRPAPSAASAGAIAELPLPRWRPWRTLRLAVLVGLGFTLLFFAVTSTNASWSGLAGWARAFGASLLFALLIGFTIDLLFVAGRRWFGRRMATFKIWQRCLYFWGIPLLGLAIAIPVANTLTQHSGLHDGPQLRGTPLGAAVFFALVMGLFYGFFAIRGRQQRAERQALEARLKLLQGQIEPHFLFNTLANVVGLMETDTPRAKLMLESFVDYLRASLGGLRRADHTLGDELELVDAYLRVIRIRMDERLHYTIDVPEALHGFALPALTLQPLVENAVVHGLEPKIAGGSLRIVGRVDESRGARRLTLTVHDDGSGLRANAAQAASTGTGTGTGSGTALANIRERLQQHHGDAATLRIEPLAPGGVCATLTLPI